jgi:uncharacterized phage protein (TIGR02218 family)
MTFDLSEKSQYGGKPIELYRFTRGLKIWTYTTADLTILFNGETYTPVIMHRGELPQNEERDNATVDVFMDPSLDLVTDFIGGATPTPTNLTIFRRHRDEASVIEQAIIWQGQVGVVQFDEGEAHFFCVPLQKGMARKVPRWLYQTQCNHMLYDAYCTVDPALYTFAGHISAIAGQQITVPEASAKVDGYYNGGFVKDGDTYLFIQTHVGSALTLLATKPKILVGDNVTLTAGCDRTRATCVAKFNNLANFMGFPYIPTKNPYSSGLT